MEFEVGVWDEERPVERVVLAESLDCTPEDSVLVYEPISFLEVYW